MTIDIEASKKVDNYTNILHELFVGEDFPIAMETICFFLAETLVNRRELSVDACLIILNERVLQRYNEKTLQ